MALEPLATLNTKSSIRPAVIAAVAGLALASGVFAQAPAPAKPVPNRPVPTAPNKPAIPGAVAQPPAVPAGAAAAPGAAGNPEPVPTTPMPVTDKGDTFSFGPFAEPVEVKLLADLVAAKLNIQILATDVTLRDKKALLLTAVDIHKDKLLEFLNFLLAQNGQALTRDATGIYIIKPVNEIEGRPGTDPFATTQVVPTPGMKPSSLQQAIANVLGGASAAPAAPGQPAPAGGGGGRIAYLDDLGIILITDTPRRIQIVNELVTTLAREQANVQFTRFALKHVAAPTAKQRILEQLGRVQQRTVTDPAQAQLQLQQQQIAAGGVGGANQAISNLADRLTIDPQGNALLFRGRPDEQELLSRLISIVDVINTLTGKWYPIGSAAREVAQQAQRLGLGTTITLQNAQGTDATALRALQPGQQGSLGGGTGQGEIGGSTFILDGQGRGFMYYGTVEQQKRVEKLVEEFSSLTDLEAVVYEFYKLRHSEADKVAEVVRALLSNSVPTSSSPLLPSGGSGSRGNTNRTNRPNTANATKAPTEGAPAGGGGGGSGDSLAIEGSDDVFVTADKSNNQIVVKAPRRLQQQFARLIDRLDLRKPQVYVDAKIVQLTDSDEFRLAVESQLINANGTGGVGTTRFPNGGSSTPTSGNILSRPNVNPLTGLTAAIIKSDQVPLVITALGQTTDARVVAEPKLLVDDNEEASIKSLEQRPTQTQSQTGGTGSGNLLTGFGGYEDAGPELSLKPQISSGDYLRLKYELKLSSFVGDGGNGLPPPRLTNEIKSDSVTVPSDSTIVLGGLVFDNIRNTVFKVPLLGDIPLLGVAFRDERKTATRTRLYVFLTPRIMRDNTFEDLRLLSRGPRIAAKIEEQWPESRPERMEMNIGTLRKRGDVLNPAPPTPKTTTEKPVGDVSLPPESKPVPGAPPRTDPVEGPQ